MTPEVIHEARRLLWDLVFQGWAVTKGGRRIQPKDEVFVTMAEKIASTRIEEPETPQIVEGFQPKETFRAISKDQPSRPSQTP